jgi:APA family basic amino acid/polyamine antiporter
MIRALASPLLTLVVWGVIGGMAICGALCYGALAARYPEAGGGSVYLREAYGRRIAFLYGWKCFLVMDPGITAALATGLASYASLIVPLGIPARRAVAIGAIASVAAVHAAGVRPGARLLATLTVAKLGLLALLIGGAFLGGAGDLQHFLPFAARRGGAPGIFPALAGAIVGAFFAFGGWWEVTKVAGEVRDPARTLPRALVIGLAIVTLTYVAATMAFIYAVPIEAVRSGETFPAQVGAAVFGSSGATFVALIVIVCIAGSLAAIVMLAPRVYFAMARDGLFPSWAAVLDARRGTPVRAIALETALAALLVAIGTFDSIIAYFIFVTVLFIAATVAGAFVLRRREGLKVPGYPWAPAGFLAAVVPILALLAINAPLQALLGTGVVALGALVPLPPGTVAHRAGPIDVRLATGHLSSQGDHHP